MSQYSPHGDSPLALRGWGGGTLDWKVVWGCAAVITLFFRPFGAPYQFTITWPSAQNCSSHQNTSLFKENQLFRSYFRKSDMWHTLTQKKNWVPPPLHGLPFADSPVNLGHYIKRYSAISRLVVLRRNWTVVKRFWGTFSFILLSDWGS